jgi:hypothetical protein
VETKKTMERINEIESWFFEKIKKTDKSLSKSLKTKSEKT